MKTAVVLGGAGFLGSHLCEELIKSDFRIFAVDDLSSGRIDNLSSLLGNRLFKFVKSDICDGIPLLAPSVDIVYNLASPASPPHYLRNRMKTLRSGSYGMLNAIAFANKFGARLIQTSTSEVYGDPTVHPQDESYWGNVNPIGERSCYDESKRFAEALCVAGASESGLNVGIARIFNTYGPRLSPLDGRVVSNFVSQALQGEPLTIYGDGQQTRSFCYVSDLISGLVSLGNVDLLGPINLGNPREISISEVARLILELTGSRSEMVYLPIPSDDPTRRRPDINRAKSLLSWEPIVDLTSGLQLTVSWFREELRR